MEQVIVGLFTEIRRHKPSVIYIPNVEAWYATLSGTVAFITFQTMLRSIPPTDPVLVLATAESDKEDLPDELLRDLFGFSKKNRMELTRPERVRKIPSFWDSQLAAACHLIHILTYCPLDEPQGILFCDARLHQKEA